MAQALYLREADGNHIILNQREEDNRYTAVKIGEKTFPVPEWTFQ